MTRLRPSEAFPVEVPTSAVLAVLALVFVLGFALGAMLV